MRTKKSIINVVSSILSSCVSILFGFVGQKILLRFMGLEYSGLNGLYSNVLSMLGILELGIGSAIVYYLYEPIAKDDTSRIKSLLIFYKKTYRIIAIIIFTVGIAIIPFLKLIITDITININIYYAYILFLISTICSYFMVYKRTLVIAKQKNYIVNIIHLLYIVFLNIIQIGIIIYTKNYYYYLLCRIVCQLIENLVITLYVNKNYPYVNDSDYIRITKSEKRKIFGELKALFFHRIGGVVVNSTDNILISSFLGITVVGLYSNYSTIITAVYNIFNQAITSINSSVGNLLTTNDEKNKFVVFSRIRFLNFWIACFTSIAILFIIKPFICIWIGEKYLLDNYVLIVLVLNYFQSINRSTYNIFKNGAGIWTEDWYVPIIESLVNIISSILFIQYWGLKGVFIGTIISSLILWCYSYPRFVYNKLFKRSYYKYIKETISYLFIYIILLLVSLKIMNFIHQIPIGDFLKLIISIITTIIIPNLFLFIIYRKDDKLKYYLNLLKKINNNISN